MTRHGTDRPSQGNDTARKDTEPRMTRDDTEPAPWPGWPLLGYTLKSTTIKPIEHDTARQCTARTGPAGAKTRP